MSYLNSVTLVGFVGSDPEQRQAKGNGSKFTVLSVATQRSWKNADDEWSSKTDWHRVVLFRPRLADHVARSGHDKKVSSEYTRELFEFDDNVAILVRNRGTGKTVQRIAKAETIASPEVQEWLAVHNASGSDVFVGMNPIKDGAYNRTKDNLKEIRHVYLDLDRHGDQSLEAIRNSPSVPAPNFVLDTSPGKHQVVWKVSGFSQDEAESLLRSLANQYGGDSAATDSTRVLRLPGFANRKLSEKFIVQVHHESRAVHTPRDFTIPDDSPEAPQDLGEDHIRGRLLPNDHKSQSERDWAYAKRALARGDAPETVMQRIADYRGDDKHDPESYARRTVTKAQAELGHRLVKPSGTDGQLSQSIDSSQDRGRTS